MKFRERMFNKNGIIMMVFLFFVSSKKNRQQTSMKKDVQINHISSTTPQHHSIDYYECIQHRRNIV